MKMRDFGLYSFRRRRFTPYMLNHKRFTLIELLVVTSIIAILFSFVLPAISHARLKSQGISGSDQLRQMGVGFSMYADDQNEFFFPSPAANEDDNTLTETPYLFKRNPDMRNVARDYNFIDLTGHPVTGAPKWDDPRNTATYLYSVWCYYPGYLKYQKENAPVHPRYPTGPMKLSRASEKHILMSELVVHDFVSPNWGPPRAVHVNAGTLQVGDPVFIPEVPTGNCTSPSFTYFSTPPGLQYLKGTFASHYDGHTEWYDFHDMVDGFRPPLNGSSTRTETICFPPQPD